MKMEIILLRHGIAEDVSDGGDDSRRALTVAGKKELKQSFPGLKCLLKNKRKPVIFSSPMRRAVQTAKILSEILNTGEIRESESIGNGDLTALCHELSQLSPKSTAIIVGHQPFLGEWSQSICAVSLPFKKGAAAAFDIDSALPLRGVLSWFMQPAVLKRICTMKR